MQDQILKGGQPTNEKKQLTECANVVHVLHNNVLDGHHSGKQVQEKDSFFVSNTEPPARVILPLRGSLAGEVPPPLTAFPIPQALDRRMSPRRLGLAQDHAEGTAVSCSAHGAFLRFDASRVAFHDGGACCGTDFIFPFSHHSSNAQVWEGSPKIKSHSLSDGQKLFRARPAGHGSVQKTHVSLLLLWRTAEKHKPKTPAYDHTKCKAQTGKRAFVVMCVLSSNSGTSRSTPRYTPVLENAQPKFTKDPPQRPTTMVSAAAWKSRNDNT